MRRIDPAATPELYRKLGWKPKRGRFYEDKPTDCGCLVGALYFDQHKRLPEPSRDWVGGNIGLDPVYVRGLINGFDGRYTNIDGGYERQEHRDLSIAGHADGRAAWAALEAAGMVGNVQ